MGGDLFEFEKGLTSILGIAFARWRNIDCKLTLADDCRELLDGSSLPDRQPII